MRVKLCKNCMHWEHMAGAFGQCRNPENYQQVTAILARGPMPTSDVSTCSLFTYKADADEYPDVRRGGGGGGGGDDGPVDITPRGPKGGYYITQDAPGYEMMRPGDRPQQPKLVLTYDPDGDKKD